MAKVKKTVDNPHGLSVKQRLVVKDMARKVKEGKPINAVESHKKIYNVTTANSAAVATSRNLSKENFRAALIDEMYDQGVIGPNSVVGGKLMEGLEAVNKDGADYGTRLKYIQEINKVVGVYAPQKVEKRSLSLHADISEKELDEKIRQLQDELKS